MKTTETLTDNEISDMLTDFIDDLDNESETIENTRYDLAINEMNECLKIRNLPDIEIMIDYFKKDHPEYCI